MSCWLIVILVVFTQKWSNVIFVELSLFQLSLLWKGGLGQFEICMASFFLKLFFNAVVSG